MLGLSLNQAQNWKEAVATALIIFAIWFLNELPEGQIPTWTEFYVAARAAALTALVIYAANRGIQWRREKKNPTSKEDEMDRP